MENCYQSDPPRTLTRGKYLIQIALISILFVPWVFTSPRAILQAKNIEEPKVFSKTRPKILVRIYSILKSNWPDVKESRIWKISTAIHKESTKYKLDPILILAMIDVESKFKQAAVSPAGARGLMQILPGTGKALLQEIGLLANANSNGFRPEFLDDPVVNIKLGIYYLQYLKKSFQSLNKALIAYNLGPTELKNRLDNNVMYPGAYAASVLDAYEKYKESQLPTF